MTRARTPTPTPNNLHPPMEWRREIEMAAAEFNQSRNDLHWSFWAGDDGTIRWSGYDDANWWDRVAWTDHARKRVGKVTGRTFVLNPETGDVTVFD